MRILKFKVENQKIYQDPSCDFTGLVKGTSGYLKAFFSFSPEWNGCKIAASFLADGQRISDIGTKWTM